MRILELNSGRDVNGAMVHTYLLTRELVALGHEVTVVCRPGYWLWQRLEGLGVQRVGSLMRRRPSDLLAITRLIRREGIEVTHSHMSRAHMFALLLRMTTGCPCVATAHNRHFQLHWRLNNFVIANSEATRQFQLRVNRVRPDRIATVHCFSDLDQFVAAGHPDNRRRMRRELGVRGNAPLIGVIGEVVERKGHVHLIRALPEIARQFPEFRLVLIGRFKRTERATRQLRRFLCEHRLYRRVIWAGRRSDVADLLAAMDVCVVPSIEEPLGLVAMEAQAAGIPLVASATGGLTEIVRDGENGLLVPVKDPGAIARAVIRLLEDPSLRERLTVNGRSSVAERFSPRRLTEEVAAILSRVSARRQAA